MRDLVRTGLRIHVAAALAACAVLLGGIPSASADPTTPATPAPAAAPKKKPPQAPKPPPPSHAKPKPAATTKETKPEPSAPAAASKPATGSAAHNVVEHESRIEFDERMVRGQSAAGAIFLFQRTPSDLKSIVEVPTTFRPKTVELLTPHRGAS
jgi:hypothetical protein